MMNPFKWSVRVYYEDTDVAGVVYYANYLKFFERARTEWLRDRGVNQQQMMDVDQRLFVVKAGAVEYHAPARLDDELIITVAFEKLGRASVEFIQEAWCGDRLLVSGKIKVCCVDAVHWRPAAIPTKVVALILI
jgi:acyl-CoA thioester hydrolase